MVYSKVFAELPEALVMIDERGRIVGANPSCARIFGYELSYLLGVNISLLMPGPYRSQHDGHLERYLQSKISSIIGNGRKLLGQRRDGSIFPMFLTVSPIEMDGNLHFIGIMRDLSAFESQEADFATLGALIDASDSYFLILEADDLRILYANHYCSMQLELSEKNNENQSHSRSFTEYLFLPDRSRIAQMLYELQIKRSERITCQAHLRSASGRTIPVELRAERGIYRQKSAFLISGIERSQERELESKLASVMENYPDHVMVLNDEFCLSYINRPELIAEELSLGLPIQQLLTSDPEEIQRACLDSCRLTGQTQRWQARLRKLGDTRWFSCALGPFSLQDAQSSYVLVLQDITQLKQTQARLEYAGKLAMIGELSAGFGHEINNPLTIVLGNILAMEKAVESGNLEQLQERLAILKRAAIRIKDSVTAFKTFATDRENSLEPISVHHCVDGTIKMVESLFAQKLVRFEYDPRSQDFLVLGSVGLLQQALMNLFANAKAGLAGVSDAKIRVRKYLSGERVHIEIIDNGVNFDFDKHGLSLDQILPASPARQRVGLGVALAAKIMHELQGTIVRKYHGPVGQAYELRLPAWQLETQSEDQQIPVHCELGPYHHVKALVVCDDMDLAALTKDILETCGVGAVMQANDMESALDLLRSQNINLLLTKTRCALGSGIALLEKVLELKQKDKPRMVIISGAAASDLDQQIPKHIAKLLDGYLWLPYQQREVEKLLDGILGRQ